MPYSKVSELPPGVKNALPLSAQKIFMSAYNSAYSASKKKGTSDKTTEKYANAIGWTAVKNAGYLKGKDGKWSKKSKAANDFDDNIINDAFPVNLRPNFGGKDEPETVPNMESYLLAPKEVIEVFVKAYESAMNNCKNAQGMNCENESFIMGLTKVRAMFDEVPKGNWVKKIVRPPKASLE